MKGLHRLIFALCVPISLLVPTSATAASAPTVAAPTDLHVSPFTDHGSHYFELNFKNNAPNAYGYESIERKENRAWTISWHPSGGRIISNWLNWDDPPPSLCYRVRAYATKPGGYDPIYSTWTGEVCAKGPGPERPQR